MATVNSSRFSGFAGLYDAARPRPPQKAVEFVLRYRGQDRLGRLVDLGSGTGLSTAVWRKFADEIIGVEPTTDMRNYARAKYPEIDFIDATACATGLATESADAVTCSQSFHWMEPTGTLAEAARILKHGGVFAAYDCQWPVSWNWEAERAYAELMGTAKTIAASLAKTGDQLVQYPKERHLENIRRCGKFRYARQLVFHNEERCDAGRFIDIALSQGSIQDLLKRRAPAIDAAIDGFRAVCEPIREISMRVGYLMNIAVK